MDRPERKKQRLPAYDYGQNGYYFVTICTKDKQFLLGSVGNAVLGVPPVVTPTAVGNIVIAAWEQMSRIDPGIKTDAFCLMPNHVHGIVVIEGAAEAERRGRRSLPDIVRAFKSVTTRQFNRIAPPSLKNCLWQKSYYDEIIRNDHHLDAVRQYIADNPAKWAEDEYYDK